VRNKLLLLALAVLAAMAAGDRGWAQSPDAVVSQPQSTTLTGVCGFTVASTDVNPSSGSFLEPRADVGTLTFTSTGPGTGTVTLAGMENKNGTIQTLSATGPYSVGSDGRTGTITFTSGDPGQFQFEIVNNGTELRFMNTGPVDPTLKIVKEVLLGVCQF
jgi:hypothetical protein